MTKPFCGRRVLAVSYAVRSDFHRKVGVLNMNLIKNLYKRALDFLEVFIPCVTFSVLFVTYVIMIIYRYLFHAQINWIYELSMIAFVWTVMLAASYASRKEDHIMFTMLYDRLSPKGQLICRILGDIIIVIFMLVLLPKPYAAIRFLAIKKTPLLKIPFNIVFAPFLAFNILTILHHAIQIGQSWTALRQNGKGVGE